MIFSEIGKYLDFAPAKIKETSKLVRFKESEAVFEQNDPADFVFIVKSGALKGVHINDKGEEFMVAVFLEGELVGEMEVFSKREFFCSGISISDSEVWIIPKHSFLEWINSDTEFNHLLHGVMSERLHENDSRMVTLLSYPMEYSLMKILLEFEESTRSIPEMFTKKFLVSYLRTNIRSLNRIIKSLTDKDIVGVDGTYLYIEDMEKLESEMLKYEEI